jgi:predicted alpha/beta-hydrolase family hydrolase
MTMFINEDIGSVNALIDESNDPKYLVILTHGAGAGMQHAFMEAAAKGLAARNAHVMRFNFPYMDAGKKLPGSPKVSQQSILAALEDINKKYWDLPIFLAGKSYGGRMCSHVVADGSAPQVKGLIYLGFPLHAPGKDGTKRADHLQQVSIPQLFLQGSNDKLARLDLIKQVVKAQSKAQLHVIDHADHSFRVPKKQQKPGFDVMEELIKKANNWALEVIK